MPATTGDAAALHDGDDLHHVLVIQQVLSELGLSSGVGVSRQGQSVHVGLEGGWTLSVMIGLRAEWTAPSAPGWTVLLERASGLSGQAAIRWVDDTEATADALHVLLASLLIDGT